MTAASSKSSPSSLYREALRSTTQHQQHNMAQPTSAYKDRQFLAVIGDEDSVTGLLLAGVGVSSLPPPST
jgi:hypothetical protein